MENKVLDKIRKLLAKAQDPASSEAEMEIFMKKAQELMMKNDLSEGDIEIHPDDINKTEVFSDLWRAFKYKHKNFEWELIDTIAGFFNCKIFQKEVYDFDAKQWRKTKQTILTVVGSNENRIVVQEMYGTLVHKFLTLSDVRFKEYQLEYKKRVHNELKSMGLSTKGITCKYLEMQGQTTGKGSWVSSYLIGCIEGLKRALKEQQKQSLQLPEDHKSWGLIVAKHDALINARVPELIGKVNKVNGIAANIKMDGTAYTEGIKDGKSNHDKKQLM